MSKDKYIGFIIFENYENLKKIIFMKKINIKIWIYFINGYFIDLVVYIKLEIWFYVCL